VLNKGVSASTTTGILERLPAQLDRYRPDIVVAMMGINDHLDRRIAPVGALASILARVRDFRVVKLYTLLAEHLGLRAQPSAETRPLRTRKPWFSQTEASLRTARAREELLRNDVAAARRRLEKILRVDPADFEALDALAYSEAVWKGPDRARRTIDSVELRLERSFASNPGDLRTRDALLRVYMMRASEKIELLRESLREDLRAARLLQLDVRKQIAGTLSDLAGSSARSGQVGEAAEDVRLALEVVPDEAYEQRARLHAQLAELQNRNGAHAEAKESRRLANELERLVPTDLTQSNYRELRRLLGERGIRLVAVQYPRRPLASLRAMLDDAPEVVFVDNERLFDEAVERTSFGALFADHFAGDFGHMTAAGKRLLAENVAREILRLYPPPPAPELGIAGYPGSPDAARPQIIGLAGSEVDPIR
jgi:lysophospholipase L1-like esterase